MEPTRDTITSAESGEVPGKIRSSERGTPRSDGCPRRSSDTAAKHRKPHSPPEGSGRRSKGSSGRGPRLPGGMESNPDRSRGRTRRRDGVVQNNTMGNGVADKATPSHRRSRGRDCGRTKTHACRNRADNGGGSPLSARQGLTPKAGGTGPTRSDPLRTSPNGDDNGDNAKFTCHVCDSADHKFQHCPCWLGSCKHGKNCKLRKDFKTRRAAAVQARKDASKRMWDEPCIPHQVIMKKCKQCKLDNIERKKALAEEKAKKQAEKVASPRMSVAQKLQALNDLGPVPNHKPLEGGASGEVDQPKPLGDPAANAKVLELLAQADSDIAMLKSAYEEQVKLREEDQKRIDEEANATPLAVALTAIDANRQLINSWLLIRPYQGIYNATDLADLLRRRSMIDGFDGWLAGWNEWLLNLPPTPPPKELVFSELIQKLPRHYEEHMIAHVDFLPRSQETATRVLEFGMLAASIPLLTTSESLFGKILGGVAVGVGMAAVLTKRSRAKLLKIVHHFSYEALAVAEQAELSRDRRNISLRLARPVETSFGIRVKHWVDFQYAELDKGIILSALDLVGLADLATRVDFIPVPVGALIGIEDEESGGLPRVVLQVNAQNDPHEVRFRLVKTLPSLNGVTMDLTLWHWLTTHPRFMDVSREFNDVKAFLRLSYCANGQIANNFMSGDYRSVYPATALITLVTWLHQRWERGGQWLQVQDWGF